VKNVIFYVIPSTSLQTPGHDHPCIFLNVSPLQGNYVVYYVVYYVVGVL
jgi:hypothetical protein